jgi:hypothetical protein
VGESQDNTGRPTRRVTIAEAAALLGSHPSTVRSRVEAGIYCAEEVETENGPTWIIERDSLTTNAPTSPSQQPVSGVPSPSLAQQEALQELAKAIVREAGIAQDPEAQARIEGNKLAAEAARILVIVASGLLVGMAAVVGVMPEASLSSPSLYLAFAFVFFSIFAGITWMRDIARITIASHEADATREPAAWFSGGAFFLGLLIFSEYVLFNYPGVSHSYTPRQEMRWALGTVTLIAGGLWVQIRYRKWQERQRSQREAE